MPVQEGEHYLLRARYGHAQSARFRKPVHNNQEFEHASHGSRTAKSKLERRKAGVLPRLENGDLTEANPPNLDRFKLWLKSNIHVEGRPDWLFVKLHTHGCKPSNMNMLQWWFRSLVVARHCAQKDGLALHFASSRENIILAAEVGKEVILGNIEIIAISSVLFGEDTLPPVPPMILPYRGQDNANLLHRLAESAEVRVISPDRCYF